MKLADLLYFTKTLFLILVGAEGFNRSCPALLYRHEGNCYVKCPVGTIPNKTDATCVDPCLGVIDCLSYDPHPPQYKEHNVYCPQGTCKQPLDKCFELQCYESCPESTVKYGSICLRSCPADKPNVLNRTCVATCPKSNQYIENNNCVSVCSKAHYLYKKTCTNKCPSDYVVFNGTCHRSCPSDFPLTFNYKNESFCLNNCPFHTVMKNETCHLQCPRNTPIIFNRTCLTSCPTYSKFTVIIKTKHNSIITCVQNCPSNFLTEGNSCVRKCSPGKMLFNKTCLFQCPSSHPFRCSVQVCTQYAQITDIVCFDKCQHVFNNTCYDSCPKETFYNNGNCVKNCPYSHPFFQRFYGEFDVTCVAECSRYRHGNMCVDRCPQNLKYFNNTCVEHCYGKFPLLQNSVMTRFGSYLKTIPRCVSSCQNGMVLYKNDCLLECPENSSYLFKNVCLENCPDSHRFIDLGNKNNCLSECNHIKFKSYCVPKCPKGLLEFNKSCVTECPHSSQFTDVSNRKCLQKCPNLRSGTTCHNQCPNGTYRYYKECVLNCPDVSEYIINTKKTKHYYYYYYATISPQCSRTCPKENYIYKKYCLPYCPKDHKYVFRRKCLTECPKSYLILIQYKENILPRLPIYSCVPDCPHNMLYENRTCKTNCSPSSKYVAYKKCYNKCPESRPLHFTYTEQHSKKANHICISHCPENSYKINNFCVMYCPPDMFGFNAECIAQCPLTHPYNYTKFIDDGQAYFCERLCPNGTFQMDNNCFDHCPEKLFSFINNTCLLKCPESHDFHSEVIVDKKYKSVFCVDHCSYFSDSNKCVSSCPSERPFNYNGQCLNSCPPSTPLAITVGNRHCSKICPNGTASVKNKDCVKICPEKTPFIFNGKCQISCPYNYTFYETVVMGKLCRDKCYNDFVVNGDECVTKCPIMKYNINGVCKSISHCPKEHPYEEKRQQGITCTNKCLETNVLDGNHCEEGCPFGYVIFNGKCITKCPKTHPNELHESAIHYTYKIYCHSICPSRYVSENGACIKEANCYNSGKYIYNGTCTAKCLPNQYVQKGECIFSCSFGYVSKNKTCITEEDCFMSGMYVHKGTCIQECKKGHYANNDYTRKVCSEKCPTDYVSENNECITKYKCYNSGRYLYNGTCIAECPIGHYILQPEYESKKLCNLKCPDKYYHNNTHCIEEGICYDSGKYIYNGTCTKECPIGHYILQREYESKKLCSLNCPDRYYHNKTHCMKCDDLWIFHEGNCLSKCPKSTLQFKQSCITLAGALTGLIFLFVTLLGLAVLFWCCFVKNCAEKGDIHQKVDTDDSSFGMSHALVDTDETCPMKLATNATLIHFPENNKGCTDTNDSKCIQQVLEKVSDTEENKTCSEEQLSYISEAEQTRRKIFDDKEDKRQDIGQITNMSIDFFDLSSESDDVSQSKNYSMADIQKIKRKDKIDKSTSPDHLPQEKPVHSILVESYVNQTFDSFDSITEEKRLLTLKYEKDYTIDQKTESNGIFDEPLLTGTLLNLPEKEQAHRKDLGSVCDLKADDETINMASFSRNCVPFTDDKSLETQEI